MPNDWTPENKEASMRTARMLLAMLLASLIIVSAVRATTIQEVGTYVPNTIDPGSSFGESLAVHEDRVLVGASWFDAPVGRGAAFLFDTNTGAQLAELLPDAYGRYFGTSVDLSDSYLVVGDPWDNEAGHHKGAIHILMQPRVHSYGRSCRGDDSATNSGCAYLYPALPLAE